MTSVFKNAVDTIEKNRNDRLLTDWQNNLGKRFGYDQAAPIFKSVLDDFLSCQRPTKRRPNFATAQKKKTEGQLCLELDIIECITVKGLNITQTASKLNTTRYKVSSTIKKLDTGVLEDEAVMGWDRRGAVSKFDELSETVIERIVSAHNGDLTYQTVLNLLADADPRYRNLKLDTLKKFMRRKMLFIRKVPCVTYESKWLRSNLRRMWHFCSILALAETRGRPVISMDETGTSGSCKARKVLCRTGEIPALQKIEISGKNISVLLACGKLGPIASYYSTLPINSTSFSFFIREFIENYRTRWPPEDFPDRLMP